MLDIYKDAPVCYLKECLFVQYCYCTKDHHMIKPNSTKCPSKLLKSGVK